MQKKKRKTAGKTSPATSRKKQDVSPRKGRDKTVVSQRAIGESFFAHSAEGILVTDSRGIITAVNPAFIAISGRKHKDMVGKKVSNLFSDASNRKTFELMQKGLSKNAKWQGEIWNRSNRGENHPFLLTVVAKQTLRIKRPITFICLPIYPHISTTACRCAIMPITIHLPGCRTVCC
jgi:PAS domain S-box-containing protein